MTRQQLQVQKRESSGTAKARNLRKQGVLPANVYGFGLDSSVPVSVSAKDLNAVLKESGETDLLDLNVEGSEETHPVLIYEMQQDPVTDEVTHVDFYRVNMDEEVDVEVPLSFEGESAAVNIHSGILITLMSELPIRALPGNLPHGIGVNLALLAEIGDQITVADLTLPENITLMMESPEDEVIVRVDAPKTAEEIEEELEGDEPETLAGEEEEAGSEEGTTADNSPEEIEE